MESSVAEQVPRRHRPGLPRAGLQPAQCGSDVMETTVAEKYRAVIGLDCHVQVYNLR